MTALREQLPASQLCMAYCCCTPLVNTHAARGRPKNDINLLILETYEPDAGCWGCLASACLTNCELSGLWLAGVPLGNRLSKDIAIPSVQHSLFFLPAWKSAAKIVLLLLKLPQKPMSLYFPANVSICYLVLWKLNFAVRAIISSLWRLGSTTKENMQMC